MKNIDFEGFYIKTKTVKSQITLHHTVSGDGAEKIAKYWKSLPGKIGTQYIIERDGTIAKLFEDEYWAGHIGNCKKSFMQLELPDINLSKQAIGIEIISFGGLTSKGNFLFNAYGGIFEGHYAELKKPFRGYDHFEIYTEAQIKALTELLTSLSKKWDIPLSYNEDIWDISKRALSGEKGLFSHTSYRLDKSDIFPQKEMVDILKTL
jgi:N-acetyl-anhydromuramyl-L-alanine amidase AmpD